MSSPLEMPDALFDEPPVRILRRDAASQTVLLLGSQQLLAQLLCLLTPLLIGVLLAGQLALEFRPWPLGNFELTLLAWGCLWLLFLGYCLLAGAYPNAYLFNPRRQWLLHLNSGEAIDLAGIAQVQRVRQAALTPLSVTAHPQEILLPCSALVLGELDWKQLQAIDAYRPLPLRRYLRRLFSPEVLVASAVVAETFLVTFLIISFDLVGFLLAHLVLGLAALACGLAGFALQQRVAVRCQALLGGRSIEDVVRDEA
ncbi:hypothetical protein F3I16_03945 [Pseudomonas sp. L-22-4S-12]|uniref:hypothetical protein n=1 Tax=Pseudomonas sp. L-22-4S-12 TaxID=2610893 RepID=UPI00132CADD1|nr:hypothetical protein [Pseudomonas sp. L-22-4S-12]MWV15191.1 hypothetical protein [Pseudomonas sp. L-22-4S-12]